MIVTAATVMSRDEAMVPHMAHVVAEVRGKEVTGIRGRRQVLMPVPTSLRNANPMRGTEPLMVMSVRKCGKTPRGVIKMMMPLPPFRYVSVK